MIRYFLAMILFCPAGLFAQEVRKGTKLLYENTVHLRTGNRPEWTGFGNTPLRELKFNFSGETNATDYTLDLVQEDVKHMWQVYLNGTVLGHLNPDEQAMRICLNVPANSLRKGQNELIIRQSDTTNDDIRVGRIFLHEVDPEQLLHQARLNLRITDKKTGRTIPSRITVTHQGNLQPVGGKSDSRLAVRTGVVYTATGEASFGLPAGSYTIFASRGHAWSVDSFSVTIGSGQTINHVFSVEKEIPLTGWISCDPHLHTLTWSGHGDATIEERMITIAGEDIDLPVFTEHNRHADPDSVIRRMQYDPPYTPVTGNEFTTRLGHFNTFPVSVREPVADPSVSSWEQVKNRLLKGNDNRVVILNHARDVHYGFRPFGPDRHISIAGLARDKQPLPANAMEVMNSGSQQHDRMELVRDWFGMLNAGKHLTPVGSSDSHDVFRYIAGQSRTYIYYPEKAPAKIDVDAAVGNFLKGKVLVSFGLVTIARVNDKYGPGETVPARKSVSVDVSVYGPSWLDAEKIGLYVNGQLIRQEKIERKSGTLKWQGSYKIPLSGQDLFLVAVAEGGGKSLPFWPIPNPYQSTSPDWNPGVIGISGAVWIDADGDGKASSAHEYAVKLFASAGDDPGKIKKGLSAFDKAVAVQYASLLYQQSRVDIIEKTLSIKDLSPATRNGFQDFLKEVKRGL